MPASRVTVREHARQRDGVAASLLLIGEDARVVRNVPIDPGTYTASAADGGRREAVTTGGILGGLPGTGRRSVDARSAR